MITTSSEPIRRQRTPRASTDLAPPLTPLSTLSYSPGSCRPNQANRHRASLHAASTAGSPFVATARIVGEPGLWSGRRFGDLRSSRGRRGGLDAICFRRFVYGPLPRDRGDGRLARGGCGVRRVRGMGRVRARGDLHAADAGVQRAAPAAERRGRWGRGRVRGRRTTVVWSSCPPVARSRRCRSAGCLPPSESRSMGQVTCSSPTRRMVVCRAARRRLAADAAVQRVAAPLTLRPMRRGMRSSPTHDRSCGRAAGRWVGADAPVQWAERP